MQRRGFLGGGLAVATLVPGVTGLLLPGQGESSAAAAVPAPGVFDPDTVPSLARALAAAPYRAPARDLPAWLEKLSYDQYRAIRFRPDRALWRGAGLPFEAQFFHRGYIFHDKVDIFEVAEGTAQRVACTPDLFDFGPSVPPRPSGTAEDLGFAGFRVHAAINRADYLDEVGAFLGASYFRAVARGQVYGLSTRGLAIRTADPGGEEFPVFKSFWLERPTAGATALIVHALLDSPSTAAAFRFAIRPGQDTVFDVEMKLFPRTDIDQLGLATLTSMYYFDSNDRAGIDDYRPAVHDSDGLLIWTGRGEQIWRPLANPSTLQVSEIADRAPRGFGLMQRARGFAAYRDLEARYERRPSAWVEFIGDPGEGAVHLVEIPTKREIDDNVVAFWRPKAGLKAKGEYAFAYRLHWCNDVPWESALATVTDTRTGTVPDGSERLYVLEFTGGALPRLGVDAKLRAEVTADRGRIAHVVAQPNPETQGWRISFRLQTAGAKVAELRVRLMDESGPMSETWISRWTS